MPTAQLAMPAQPPASNTLPGLSSSRLVGGRGREGVRGEGEGAMCAYIPSALRSESAQKPLVSAKVHGRGRHIWRGGREGGEVRERERSERGKVGRKERRWVSDMSS